MRNVNSERRLTGSTLPLGGNPESGQEGFLAKASCLLPGVTGEGEGQGGEEILPFLQQLADCALPAPVLQGEGDSGDALPTTPTPSSVTTKEGFPRPSRGKG